MWIEQQYNDTVVGFNNGQNEIWLSADPAYNPAVTFSWFDFWTGYTRETDVVFYNGVSWTASMDKLTLSAYGGTHRPFENTVIHEYGHVAGLGHEDDEYNIMGADYNHMHCNGSTARSYVGEDACDGLIHSYGYFSGGSLQDVSVSMFEYAGRSGGYSVHNLCDVYEYVGGSAQILPSDGFNGQRRYQVIRGNTYLFEFTYENNGENTQTVRAGFYLSTNSIISTGDRLLTTETFTLGRGTPNTIRSWVTIPTSTCGDWTYYLGVIVDDNDRLVEADRYNNAAYHIIKTD
jgi:hypothetical protein